MNNYIYNILWLDNIISISIDVKVDSKLSFPITSYYYWPREDGWEILKSDLESKLWIDDIDKTKILNTYKSIVEKWCTLKGLNELQQFISENPNYILVSRNEI